MKKMAIATAAALALAACDAGQENAEELPEEPSATIDVRGLVEAAGSAIDREATERLARQAFDGEIKEAVREALPTEQIGVAAAIVDEEALIAGIDRAINGDALRGTVRNAIEGGANPPVRDTEARSVRVGNTP